MLPGDRPLISQFLVVLDLVGTFAFALSGAVAGVKHRLDLYGVLVLSFAAATAGGIMRDLLIGATPPAAIADPRYLVISLVAGVTTFYWLPIVVRHARSVLFLDAAGLALFAVTGALKALAAGLGPVAAVLLGMVTGIGGGIARDLLVAEVPVVLRADLYAVASLAGAAVVVDGHLLRWPPVMSAAAGALLCLALRIVAIQRGWRLPTARWS